MTRHLCHRHMHLPTASKMCCCLFASNSRPLPLSSLWLSKKLCSCGKQTTDGPLGHMWDMNIDKDGGYDRHQAVYFPEHQYYSVLQPSTTLYSRGISDIQLDLLLPSDYTK